MNTARVIKSFAAVAVTVGAFAASDASAAVYNLSMNSGPAGTGPYHSATTNDTPGEKTLGLFIGNYVGEGAGVKVSWLQFQLPTLGIGETITSVVLNTHVIDNRGSSAPGAIVRYTSDDAWDFFVPDFPTQTSAGAAPEAEIAGIGGFVAGDYETNITSFVSEAGEGSGQTLSMSIHYYGGGVRGAFLGFDQGIWGAEATAGASLTVTTIPEPAGLGLLLAGGLLALRRRR